MKRTDTETELKVIELYTTPAPDGSWIGNKTIGLLLGIYPTVVHNILKRHNIPIRSCVASHANGKRCKPIKNLSPKGEAPPFCKCGCDSPVDWNQRKNRWNVYVKGHYRNNLGQKIKGYPHVERPIDSSDMPFKNPDWLYEEYITRHQSAQDIAVNCGVNPTTIRKYLRRFGVPVRTSKESLILSKKNKGSNNPSWKGGIAKWNYAPSWKRIAHDIRKRDGYTCQICKTQFPKSSKFLHVHHMDGDKFNNIPSNLVTVCATCHPKGKRKENGLI